MFGFLKKKLKDAVERISGVAKEEPSAEEIEKAEAKIETRNELDEETREKEILAEEAGFEITPEVKEAIEKPAERILGGQEPERTAEEIVVEKETEKISEEMEVFEEKPEELIEHKTEPESKHEEVTIEIQKSSAEEVALPEFRREDEPIEKEPEGVTFEEIKPEKDVSQKKKSLLEKLGMRKPKKEKGLEAGGSAPNVHGNFVSGYAEKLRFSCGSPDPRTELPPGFESAGEAEKKEEKEKSNFFGKIRKAISEKTLEEADIKDILWDLQIGLIENDVAAGAAEKITSDLKSALVGKSMPKKGIEYAVKDSMKKSVKGILDAGELNLEEKIKAKKPFLAVFLGFNGVGKTTTIARVDTCLRKRDSTAYSQPRTRGGRAQSSRLKNMATGSG